MTSVNLALSCLRGSGKLGVARTLSLVIHWQVYRDPSGGRGPVRITNATEPTLCGTTLPVGLDGAPSDAAVPSWVDQVPALFL